MIEGCDYSFGRPGGAALAKAGKAFACRYVDGVGKALTRPEAIDLLNNGISIVANFESTQMRPLDGWPAGVDDAITAKHTMDALGFPDTCPCYFSVDFNASGVQQAAVDQYLKGAASVLTLARVGVYGSYAVCTRCKGNGTASFYWQSTAWSSGHVAPWIHLLQWKNSQSINGAAVDFDRAYQVSYGQWQPASSGPALEDEVIYSRGGLKTAIVKAGTPYANTPAGPTIGHIAGDMRFLCAAYDQSGQWVAIDGAYLTPQGAVTVPMGWITTAEVSSVQDAIVATDCSQAVQDAITKDRATAFVAYRSAP